MESQRLQMQSDHSKDRCGLVVGLPWIVYGFSIGCMVGLLWIVCGFAMYCIWVFHRLYGGFRFLLCCICFCCGCWLGLVVSGCSGFGLVWWRCWLGLVVSGCSAFGLLVGGGWLRERNRETEIRDKTEIKREEW